MNIFRLRTPRPSVGAVVLLAAVCVGISGSAAFAQPSAREQAFSEYTKGVFLLESGQPSEAVNHLLLAWELSQQDETIGTKLAEAYFRLGDLRRCDEVLQSVLTQNAENRDALFLRARIYYLQDNREGALKALLEMKRAGGVDPETQRMIARIQFELGRDEAALESYSEATAAAPDDPSLRYMQGLLLRKLGRTEEAIATLEAALELEPANPDVVMELTEILREAGRGDDALNVLNQFLEIAPTNDETVLLAANLYLEQEQPEEAIRVLRSAASESTLSSDAMILLGRALFEAEHYEESLAAFEAIYQHAKGPELARVVGDVALRAGKTSDARRYYQEAIDQAPRDYRGYLALFFAGSEEFRDADAGRIELTAEESRALLARAAEVASEDDFDAQFMLGVSYESVDAGSEAERHLARSVKLRPDDDRARLNLASVLEKMRRYQAAEEHIIAVYSVKPDDPTVCNFYGYLLALMGKDLDRAEELIRKAIAQDPDNGYYVDSLGWVHFARGEYERAVAELERAAGLVGDDPIIQEHLGDAYSAVNRYRDALAAYEKALILQQGNNDTVRAKIDSTRRQLEN